MSDPSGQTPDVPSPHSPYEIDRQAVGKVGTMKLSFSWQDRITFAVSVVIALVALWLWIQREPIASGAIALLSIYNGVTPVLNRSAWNNAFVLGHASAITHLMDTYGQHEIVSQDSLHRWALHELRDTAEMYRMAAE